MKARGRISLREQIQRNQQALDIFRPAGAPGVVLNVPPEPKKRAAAVASGNPSEAEILRAVMQLVKAHPKVQLAYRQNSGTFAEQNRDGSTRYVRANTQRGMSDIAGLMKDGRALYIEVKSATGRVQPHQQEFLDKARAAGAVAGVCRSVEDALELLGAA